MRIACLQNPVGSVKDALGGALSKALALSPGLNVTSRKSRTLQTQRFAAKQRHGFGFHLADVAGRHFGIGQVGFIAMTEQLVAELMEKGSTGVLRNRADRIFWPRSA